MDQIIDGAMFGYNRRNKVIEISLKAHIPDKIAAFLNINGAYGRSMLAKSFGNGLADSVACPGYYYNSLFDVNSS